MTQQTDAQLISACLAGESAAWDKLIGRYSPLIYTIPLRFGFSPMLADEMFQQTCIILLEKLDTLQNSDRLSAWLVTVTRRHCIHHLRRQKEERSLDEVELAADAPSVEQMVSIWEQRQHVLTKLATLGDKCEQLLTLLFLQEPQPSYDDIAARLGMAVGSIGATRRRCLQRLRDRMED